ncbi:hypothetical protein [Mammaliicoccus lentus]|uniref:hypothetical protein n=1 Tax=Mammaliicoccus lentus TaxID=42858 RepID=UPI0021C49764|nr:hypothetical protein [Mammaliicoccus lentus]
MVNFYWNYLTGGQLYGLYAKDTPFKNNFNGLATVYENAPLFLPQTAILLFGMLTEEKV